jgi:transposase-like protein
MSMTLQDAPSPPKLLCPSCESILVNVKTVSGVSEFRCAVCLSTWTDKPSPGKA